jgi:hypothetical protein
MAVTSQGKGTAFVAIGSSNRKQPSQAAKNSVLFAKHFKGLCRLLTVAVSKVTKKESTVG